MLEEESKLPRWVGPVLPRPSGSPPLSIAPQHLDQGAHVFAIMSTLLFFIVRGKFYIPTSLSRVENWKDESIVIFLVLSWLHLPAFSV